jgi:hypothetical protein
MKRQQLKEYCEAEFENIDAVMVYLYSVVKPKKNGYSVIELAAMATFLHNFYNGVENVLKRVLSISQIEMKDAPTWHKELLKKSVDLGIINLSLFESLSNYLSFRHFFVHSYSFTLRWEELKPLVNGLDDTLKRFKSAVNDYINKPDR